MPELTRRLTWPDSNDTWSIYYGDVAVGRIARNTGSQRDFWRWAVGLYPGRHPADSLSGSADTFELAREAWAEAWAKYLPGCTEKAFQAWRDEHEWTADKHALWDAGFNNLTVDLKCSCGMIFSASDRAARRLHIPHLARRKR